MTSILIFILVLSVLVFVHELGHFVAAKMCNIYVDQFSIGMPPRIAGFRRGETDYCIGALPIGGYVKMAGQEDAPLSDEERDATYGHVPPERWFNKKPVWQRAFVLLAGPAMNIVLGIAIYSFVAYVGEDVPEMEISGRIGEIDPGSPALTAPLWKVVDGVVDTDGNPDTTGWQTGDLVTDIDGHEINAFEDILGRIVLGGGNREHEVRIVREDLDGTATEYFSRVKPELLNEDDEFARFGIAPYRGVELGEIIPGSPASGVDLQEGDRILAVNDTRVDLNTFINTIETTPAGDALNLHVVRDGESRNVSVVPKTEGRVLGVTWIPAEEGAEYETAQPMVGFIDDTAKEELKLHTNDVITKVNGAPATIQEMRDLAVDAPNGVLTVSVERPAVLFGLMRAGESLELELPVASVRAIGARLTEVRTHVSVPLSQAFQSGVKTCIDKVMFILELLRGLFMRDVSPANLGGPVMIYQVTDTYAKLGIIPLMKIMAFISINLGIFNLLPLPVLDGGQLVIHSIEGIRRKPVSIKFQERYQQVGIVMIIGLMLFVTWNDVTRMFSNMLN